MALWILSRTTQVSRRQNQSGFTGARDSELQWYQLGHMQICTSPHTHIHTSIPPLSFLHARCSSCCPTNNVKGLMELRLTRNDKKTNLSGGYLDCNCLNSVNDFHSGCTSHRQLAKTKEFL